jgi:hypothetical protein
LIVALSIALIVIGVTSTFLVFGTNFLTKTEISSEDKMAAEDAADYAKDLLLYATSIKVVRASEPPRLGGADASGNILYIGSDDGTQITNTGKLYYRRAGDNESLDVLGGSRYAGMSLALSYSAVVAAASDSASSSSGRQVPAKSFELVVSAIRNGQAVYDSKKSFSLYEVAANSEPTSSEAVSSWSTAGNFDSQAGKFYLLISIGSSGYSQTSLVAQFDAIDNDIDAAGRPYHNPNATIWRDLSGGGNDIKLTFTGNTTPIREQSIYFDGDGDSGVIQALDLSSYSSVTVEICFSLPRQNVRGILYEHSPNTNVNSGGFAMVANADGTGTTIEEEIHSYTYDLGTSGGGVGGARDFNWPNNPGRLATISMVFSVIADTEGRLAYVDGSGPKDFFIPAARPNFSTSKATELTGQFRNDKFYIASRASTTSCLEGEIFSLRIYGTKLTPEQIAQNAQTDRLRFDS